MSEDDTGSRDLLWVKDLFSKWNRCRRSLWKRGTEFETGHICHRLRNEDVTMSRRRHLRRT